MHWLIQKAEEGIGLSPEEAHAALQESVPHLLAAATKAREIDSGNDLSLCSILNAKCGSCSEDCIFCAQSCHYATEITSYSLLPKEQMIQAFDKTLEYPIRHFSLVTSGKRVSQVDIDQICMTIKERSHKNLSWCASLGCLSYQQLCSLRDAGMKRYHHNLETAKSHFSSICTTHSYEDRVATVKAAQKAGLEVCSGGLFGLGESATQRIELAFALKELDVDSTPLNFLIPIPKTPAAQLSPLTKNEILQTIALFRLICRNKEIRVCGGREFHLKEEDSSIFAAGANGMMVGGYLTREGNPIEKDLHMSTNAGMCP